jgi:nitroreductase
MIPSHLSADELLTTTRAVRKRLDLEKPVEPELIRDCIEIALQAPTGGNTQRWHFIAVFDAERRAALTELYRQAWKKYRVAPGSVYDLFDKEPASPRKDQLGRVCESADYLVDNLERVPVHVIPCVPGRPDKVTGQAAIAGLAAIFGSILPATWSFMLAARAHGLGTCWTTAHLYYEREAAEVLGIPYDEVTQVALIPTAHYTGNSFSPSLRKPVDEVLHIDGW